MGLDHLKKIGKLVERNNELYLDEHNLYCGTSISLLPINNSLIEEREDFFKEMTKYPQIFQEKFYLNAKKLNILLFSVIILIFGLITIILFKKFLPKKKKVI